MDPTQWAKISDILEAVLEKDENDRSAYLTQVCGNDTDLRQEIESLLSYQDTVENDVFENNQVNSLSILNNELLSNNLIGKQIGKYKLTKLLGEGGMGAVFLAERTDGEFEQEVAVKLLKQGFVSQISLNRFVSERQILARLHHRFIAQLLDGGTTNESLPYLVMEYIEGLPFLEYCNKYNLELKERLELFQKICSAVQYAHQHLVIHRDLKPSNILVTDDGEPKLLDFGISKLISTDESGAKTQTEFQAMTPGYASPEQLKGETISTATDVYSLGVILYELLTGKLPFKANPNNFSEIIKAVTETEPIRPSSVVNNHSETNKNPNFHISPSTFRNLKGDLDNIILMALRKEPERRYSSVDELNNDISNYLNELPVSARPNTFSYRASKFFLRNKTASIVGLLLALSLIIGIVATTWQAIEARQERDRAEKRFQDVRKLSNSILFEITPKIERLPGSTEAREILVERALEYLDSLSNESANDPALQSELASAYEKVGDVKGNPNNANLGDLQGGMESYEKAQKIRLALSEADPDDFEVQRLLAANYNSTGDFRWWASNVEGSMESYNKSIEIFNKLIAQNPNNLQIQLDLVNSIYNKIKVISYNGNYQESVNQYKQLLQKIEQLELRFSKQTELSRFKGLVYIRIAYDLSWQNRYDILDEYVKKAFEVSDKLFDDNKNDTKIRRSLYYVYFQAGEIYVDSNPPLSCQYLERSLEIIKQTVERDPLNLQAKFDSALSYSKLGEVSIFQKKFDDSINYLLKAKEIIDELISKETKHDGYRFSLANNYSRISTAQEGKGDFQNAFKNAENAYNQYQTLYQADPNNNMNIRAMALVNQDLGRISEKSKQQKNALVYYQKSVELFDLLKQKNAMGDYDNKTLETSKKALLHLQSK